MTRQEVVSGEYTVVGLGEFHSVTERNCIYNHEIPVEGRVGARRYTAWLQCAKKRGWWSLSTRKPVQATEGEDVVIPPRLWHRQDPRWPGTGTSCATHICWHSSTQGQECLYHFTSSLVFDRASLRWPRSYLSPLCWIIGLHHHACLAHICVFIHSSSEWQPHGREVKKQSRMDLVCTCWLYS